MAIDSTTSAVCLDIPDFINLAVTMGPEIPIMVRGRHGIGKSQVVYQIAKRIKSDFYKNPNSGHNYEDGLPVMEFRLSQITEGDMIGLPIIDGDSTTFRPAKEIVEAGKRPMVLFFDELNRAIKQVEQGVFQIADSKRYYNVRLHPETRVYAAVNIGEQYSVEDFDPAALSRWAVVDLTPSHSAWIAWARQNCHPATVEFIAANPKDLEYGEVFEPNNKYPDRRAWHRLDTQLQRAGLFENPNSMVFYHLTSSMVGSKVGQKFWNYVKNRDSDISALDILNNWSKSRDRMPNEAGARMTKFVELTEKFNTYLDEKPEFTKEQAASVAEFMKDLPPEHFSTVWNLLTKIRKNLLTIQPLLGNLVIERVAPLESRKKQAAIAAGNNPTGTK